MKKYWIIGFCLVLIVVISELSGADGVLPLILIAAFILAFIYSVVWVVKKAWKG